MKPLVRRLIIAAIPVLWGAYMNRRRSRRRGDAA